jgi:hypothetical protein
MYKHNIYIIYYIYNMAFTRFHDDPCRIEKQLQESTGTGKYRLNVPGNGIKPCFMEDPFIRMQKWGSNLMTNTINLESDLMGLTRSSNRDCINKNNYNKHRVVSDKINYPSCLPSTEQTRATNPAWQIRDLEQVDWYTLPLDPQENTCIPFQNNLSTRILEKDGFVPTAPCIPYGNSDPIPISPFVAHPTNLSKMCTGRATCNTLT